MSDRTFVINDQPTISRIIRRVNGELKPIDPDFNEYVNLPLDAQGVKGRFKLSGISETYVYNSPQYGEQTKVRLEILILKLPGFEELTGKRFTQSYPWPKNIADDRSKLGQLLRAFLNRNFHPSEQVNPDNFIETEFVTSATVELSQDGQKTYSGISREAIERRKTVLSPYLNGSAPQPEPALVGAGGDDGADPFEQDADDL